MALRTRVVLVYRKSELTELIERHGTRGQAKFYLESRGQTLDAAQTAHDAVARARDTVLCAVPQDWAVAQVERRELARFLPAPEDRVVVVGQDGLVANVAKHLDGQLVIGVNPLPGVNSGALVRHSPETAAVLVVAPEMADVAQLTMVRARFDDGQELTALNEIYLGDPGHQSARYELKTIAPRPRRERQSSSGLIVGTGTGATGWCASLAQDRGIAELPGRCERRLQWFVREAWPSPSTGRTLTEGAIGEGDELAVTVESDRLVAFGDGMEADRLTALAGQEIRLGLADRRLRLAL
jgi:NAD kinase